jgi:hypothetical protein
MKDIKRFQSIYFCMSALGLLALNLQLVSLLTSTQETNAGYFRRPEIISCQLGQVRLPEPTALPLIQPQASSRQATPP